MNSLTTTSRKVPNYSGVRSVRERYVKVLLVVDGSASMAGYVDKTKAALRVFLAGLRSDTESNYLITSIWFSNDVVVQCLGRPLSKVEVAYHVDSGTALWDGIWRGLEVEIERIDPVLCLIISDGAENSSQKVPDIARQNSLSPEEFIRRQIEVRIGWGNWSFCWLGMAGSSFQATKVGVKEFLDFNRDDIFDTMKKLSERVRRFSHNLRVTGTKQANLLGA